MNAAADVLPRREVNGAPIEPKLPVTATTVADAATEIDLRTAPQPDADALIDLAARALSEGQLPTESGKHPQDVLTINLPVLQGRIGTAQLAFGGPINTDTTRRLARDARIIPVVLGSRGEPLDVARTTRTLPTAIRRDGGCAFPGCSVPARWCDIHHIIHWDDNGPTRTTPSIWFPIGCESASNGKLLRSLVHTPVARRRRCLPALDCVRVSYAPLGWWG